MTEPTDENDEPIAFFEVPEPSANSDKSESLLSFEPSVPIPPRPRASKAARGNGKPPEWHALYRFYNAENVLLYVGETNNPVERYIEHREAKEWWPEVARHSIEWSPAGRESMREREKYVIRDEWPLYNIAHQPRADGFDVPSYVTEKILDAVRGAVLESMPDATEEQLDHIRTDVGHKFMFDNDEDGIDFGIAIAPGPKPLDLRGVIDALGPFRPDITNSMRDPQPQHQRYSHCPAARGEEHCAERFRVGETCPRVEEHTADIHSMILARLESHPVHVEEIPAGAERVDVEMVDEEKS